MKTKILLFTFVFITICTKAQSPTYQLVKSIGGTGSDWISKNIATDLNGNLLVTGYFYSPTLTFGSITLTNTVYTGTTSAVGYASMFIAKYDASGNVIWAKSVGASGDVISLCGTADANGNFLVTGFFNSNSLTFGAFTLANSSPNPNGEMFIVKFDPSGSVLWAKCTGGSSADGIGIKTDAFGNVLVTGNFESSFITIGTTTLMNTGNQDLFITKFDANGNLIWAKSAGGTDVDQSIGFTTDVNGNIFVTGFFASPSITFGNTTLTKMGTGFIDMFIVKYDGNGNALWAKNAGGNGSDDGKGVAVDPSGNILVTGNFASAAIPFGSTTLTNGSPGTCDMFIVKYDAGGNIIWAKGVGGNLDESGEGIATDAIGNVLVTGSFFSPSVTFGSTTLTNANSGSGDMFLVRYDVAGNAIWAKSAGGSNDDGGDCVAIDANQNIFVTGDFNSSSISFGATTLINAGNVNSINYSTDGFILKLAGGLTGINENNLDDNAISFFPNPASTKITIDANINGKLIAELFDLNGQIVFSKSVVDKESIDVKNYNEGVYTLAIKTEKGIITKKILVLR